MQMMSRRADGENGSTHQEAVIGQIFLFFVVSDCPLGVERFTKQFLVRFILQFWGF